MNSELLEREIRMKQNKYKSKFKKGEREVIRALELLLLLWPVVHCFLLKWVLRLLLEPHMRLAM